MRKFVLVGLVVFGIAAFICGCRSNPDGIKSEIYTKKTSKTQELIIE